MNESQLYWTKMSKSQDHNIKFKKQEELQKNICSIIPYI